MGIDVAPAGTAGEKLSGPGTPPPRSAADRVASFDPADFPLPTGREEDWRFTPLKRLRGLLDGAASDGQLKWTADLPEGVTATEVAAGDARLREVPAPIDRASALAHANAATALVVSVPAGSAPDRPVVVELAGESAATTVWGHVVLDVGANASAVIVLDHTGSTTYSGLLSVLVGDGATLTLVSLQDWEDDTVHLEHQAARVGRDASLLSAVVTLGGEVVRLVPTVSYSGPGGNAELLGLYFADSGQHLEHRLFVDHDTPQCRSRVTYKGALQGRDAHAVWIGDVLIRATATATDTYEENRNLLLTDGARADSVPNLEIETGEVTGAGHASTTGRFDDEQLFYLQARGIPADEARRLVVRGFFAEIVDRIGVPQVRERLLQAVEDELEVTQQ
jgi:Fe-S cluster assembly protein SufD